MRALPAVAALLAAIASSCSPDPHRPPESPAAVIERLYQGRQSGVVVEAAGVVDRVLRDDLEGSRHQRFVISLPSGRTLLVSHNIDLARRVEGIAKGDRVEFRGQYEWNERGGVIHWTHHDPEARRPGGWIRHRSITYR